jgi:Tfp pilus assembly protein PilF
LYYNKGKLDPQFSETISPRNAHNDYLQIAAELGLTGIVISALFALTIMAKMRALLSSASSQIRLLTIVITAAITGGAVNGFFDFPVQLALPPFLMMLMCGALCGVYTGAEDSPGKPLAPMLRIPLVMLLLIAAVFLGRYHFLGFKAYAHYFNVMQLSKAQRWPEACDEGEKAIALIPGLGNVYTYIGMAQIKMGQPRQAAASLDRALTFYPNSLITLKYSGMALAAAGSLDQAAARFTRYLEIKPDVAQIHELLADTYRRQGKVEIALGELLLGADLEPDDGKRYIEVGRIAEEYNHHLLASEAFSKAVAFRPDWGTAHYYYGSSLYRLNRKADGAHHLRKALALGVTPQAEATIRHLLATE